MRRARTVIALLTISMVVATFFAWYSLAGGSPKSENVKVQAGETYNLVTDASGKVKEVRLIEFMDLKGEGVTDVVQDYTLETGALKWQGVHGFKTPKVEGDKLVWDDIKVDGNANVQSSATLDKDAVEKIAGMIPLEIKYRYYFDGQEIKDPAEITGRDGHFRLEMSVKNTSKKITTVPYQDPVTGETVTKEVETYLPLVIQPNDWFWDTSVFYNVKTDPTGVVVRFPEMYVTGWSMPLFPPAAKDSHTIRVEADVEDFFMPPLSLSVNFIFPGTNQENPVPRFQASLAELYNGVVQLDAGLREAVAGVGSEDAPDTMINGTSQILDGLKQMADPAKGLPYARANIDKQMIPGVAQAAAGIGSETTPDTLLYAIDQTASGLNKMKAGLGTAGTGDTLLYALDQMRQGMEEIRAGIGAPETPDTLLYAGNEIREGLRSIKEGIGKSTTDNTLLNGMHQIKSGLQQIGDDYIPLMLGGLNQLSEGIKEINTVFLGDPVNPAPDTLLGGINLMSKVLDILKIVNGVVSLIQLTVLPQINSAIGLVNSSSATPEQKQAIVKKLNDVSGTSLIALLGQLASVQLIIGDAGNDNSVLGGLRRMKDGIEEFRSIGLGTPTTPDTLSYGIAQLQKGLSRVKSEGIDKLMSGSGQIEDGLKEIRAGLGAESTEDTLLYGISQMNQGLNKIKQGIGDAQAKDTLLYAVAQVQDGLEQMKAGIGDSGTNPSLLYAMSQVQMGLHQMKGGLSSGDPSNPGLKEGLVMVSDGLGKAVAGLGSAGRKDTLIYGMTELNKGAKKLGAGLVMATDEGTALMLEGMVEGLAELSLTQGQLEVIAERGREFNHLIGQAEDADNYMTFLYETPAAHSYKEGSSKTVALILAAIIAIVLTVVGIAWGRRAGRTA